MTSPHRSALNGGGGGGFIPGMGENKQVPRVLNTGFFGYVEDAFSQRTPELPCERGETRAIGRPPQVSSDTH